MSSSRAAADLGMSRFFLNAKPMFANDFECLDLRRALMISSDSVAEELVSGSVLMLLTEAPRWTLLIHFFLLRLEGN